MSEFDKIRDAIVAAVRDNVAGKKIGVAFSGGLDSGLVSAIAKDYAESVTLYTCGTSKAYDVVMARDLSQKLELPWVHVPISKGTTEPLIRELISATGTSDPFTISYELQLFSVCKQAKEEIILTGQGADEYFMGCAKFVNENKDDYEILKNAGVERLLNVSVPCEKQIAKYFKKELVYPYLDSKVIEEISKIDQDKLRPKDLDSRKWVLKQIAIDLGHPVLAQRKKKSSQYGSGTTDIIRALAKDSGKMYNEYIASVYDEVLSGITTREWGAVINARIDYIVKVEAEKILKKEGVTPSQAIEKFYKKIIEDGKFSD